MSWADELPRLRAEREAWQAKHGPALRARDEQQARDRARIREIVLAGLDAVNATDADRALIFAKLGVQA